MRVLAAVLIVASTTLAFAQPVEPVLAQARANKAPLLDTLKELVLIESGSRDAEGLERIAELIAAKLKGLGAAQVELVEAADIYRMEDTPDSIGRMVRATFRGKGKKKIMLLAHMDTVYPRGMLEKQPFRIDGDRAYGLGIADDKQGIALILHAIAMLRTLGFNEYGTLTVLINGDEEISSPGSRALITRLGAEHDATLSFEASASNRTSSRSPPPASPRSRSRSTARPRTPARRRSAASTLSTSSATRSCRRATCPTRRPASR